MADYPSTDSLNKYGSSGFVIEIMGELSEDQYGLSTCSLTGRVRYGGIGLVPGILSSHPVFTWLALERRRMITKEGFITAVCEYVGLNANQTDPIYELCLGVGDERIEAHPKFVSDIAGQPSAPKNGAIFVDGTTGRRTANDATGVFSHFSTLYGGVWNLFAGVESYLDFSQAVWRKRQYTTFQPGDISRVGKIDTPEGPVPGLGGSGRNWLLQSINFERRGNIYSVTKEWKASAQRGWNQTIYGL